MEKQTEDIGEEIIDKLKEINMGINKLKLRAKKNSQLHLVLNTEVLNEMKKRAKEKKINLSEWCRQKLIEDSQLDRIENKLDKLLKN